MGNQSRSRAQHNPAQESNIQGQHGRKYEQECYDEDEIFSEHYYRSTTHRTRASQAPPPASRQLYDAEVASVRSDGGGGGSRVSSLHPSDSASQGTFHSRPRHDEDRMQEQARRPRPEFQRDSHPRPRKEYETDPLKYYYTYEGTVRRLKHREANGEKKEPRQPSTKSGRVKAKKLPWLVRFALT